MLGAIIGDLAGSIYEYSQVKKVSSIKINNLIEENAFFSDDTMLTIAITDAIINSKDYSQKLKEYAFKYNNSDVNVEIYRYDSKKHTDVSKEIINEVKENGCFTLKGSDEKIDATLSADDNFLLIYQDSSTEKKNENKKADAEKFFKEYKAK